jgi:hypothetical protein
MAWVRALAGLENQKAKKPPGEPGGFFGFGGDDGCVFNGMNSLCTSRVTLQPAQPAKRQPLS